MSQPKYKWLTPMRLILLLVLLYAVSLACGGLDKILPHF